MIHSHRGATGGFTLVELLAVMSIILLLLGMLMPTVVTIMESRHVHRCSYYVSALGRGAESYWTENRNYYPGQLDSSVLTGNGGPYTGSQVMAARMFGYGYDKISHDNPEPSSKYVKYNAGMLFDPNDMYANSGYGGGDRPNTLSDGFPDPLPILYFPSRRGKTGLGQYKLADNNDYQHRKDDDWRYPWGRSQNTFEAYIENEDHPDTSTGIPYNDGEFLLIAPGRNRRYGDDDDIRNW